MNNSFLVFRLCFMAMCLFGAKFSAFSQNGGIANHWYFGNLAGLDFSTGSPVSVAGPISTYEGVATISDVNGNLLFSTDGVYVYDKTNIQMPNGFGLYGDPSATQSGIIIPDPANSQQYYIFIAPATGGNSGVFGGIAYSKVDMTLNNGKGDVTTKNVTLVNPAVEKLTAIRHCNGTDFWVICHEWLSDAFYAYLITANGISAPVISHVGSIYTNISGSGMNEEAIGYMKASPDGKKIASAIWGGANLPIELFDFNNSTGILSNPVMIATPGYAYGLSFSPNSQLLYATLNDDGTGSGNNLVQYNLMAANISASVFTVNAYGMDICSALQLGPDGKIYVAVSFNPLSSINNPNNIGAACGFVLNAVTLTTGSCNTGLPNFPDNLLAPSPQSLSLNIGNDTTICGNFSLTLDATTAGATSYLWSNGQTTPTISVNQVGAYSVTVSVLNGAGACAQQQNLTDVINIMTSGAMQQDIVQDVIVCNGQSVVLNAGSGYVGYSWSTGATTQAITVPNPGLYSVWVDNGNCTIMDNVMVSYNNTPAPIAMFSTNTVSQNAGVSNVSFVNTSSNALNYMWDFGDGTISNLPQPYHAFNCNTQYQISLIAYNVCGSDTSHFTYFRECSATSIYDISQDLSLSVFPIPSQDFLHLKYQLNSPEKVSLEIINALGQVVYQTTFSEEEGDITKEVNVSELARGSYFLQINTIKGTARTHILLN